MKAKSLLFALLLAGILVKAQDLNQPIPLNPKVKTGQLANGLHYLIIQNKKPENKVELRLAVNVGSILEDDDQQGLAHFTEHMNFNGLKHFPHNEVVHYLQSIGVKFGADLNAYTGFDETVYMLPIPSDNKAKLDSGFTILADWSGNALLDTSEINSERGVVLEESRLGKGASERMFRKWLPRMLNGSRYGKRLPIGKDTILRTFKYDVLKRFYQSWYRPDLECVIVAGDIDPSEAERLIKEKFSAFKNPEAEHARSDRFDLPARNSSETMVVSDPEASNTILQIMGSSYVHKEDKTAGDYRHTLTKNLFDEMLSERYEELKNNPDPPFVYGGASIEGGYFRGWDNFSAYAVCGAGKMKEATMALVGEAMRAKKFGFTEAELKRAKANLLSGYEKSYNERDKTESAQLVSEMIRHYLQEEALPGITWEYTFTKQVLPGITLSEVNEVGKKIDIDHNYFAVITSKASEKLPTEMDLKNWIDEALNAKVTAYEEKNISSSLLEKEPAKGKIVKEDKNEKLGTKTFTLSNGAKVTIKMTDFKNDEIICRASRFGGSSLYEGKDYQSADYCNNIVDEMGYGSFSNTDLQKFLSGKVVSVNTWIDKYTDNVDGSSTVKDLKTMFQLLYLKCTSPRKDETAFKSYINREKQRIETLRSNPQYLFMDSAYHIMYNNNPRAHLLPVSADFDQLNLDHAVKYYTDRMSSANGMDYFFIGSFSEEEIKPLIEQYIGGLSGNRINTHYKDLGIDPITGKNSFTLRKGEEQKSLINDYEYGNIPYDINDETLTALLADVINNEIIDTLREKMSGIYGGGISLSISKFPKETYTMRSSLPCGPENVNKLETAFWKIIAGAKEPGGITPYALKRVTETALQKYKVNIKTNEYWLAVLSRYDLLGNDSGRILTYEERVKAVTPDKLTQTANKFFNSGNVYKALWMPKEKK
jgi:zinc protease